MTGLMRDCLSAVLLGLLLSTWSSAAAQSETEPAESPEESAPAEVSPPEPVEATAEPATPEPAGDVIYRKGPDGQWKPVPVDQGAVPSLIDLLAPTQEPEADVPDYFISKLAIDGSATGNWAELTARLEIRTTRDSSWLRVPLRFDQGVLLSYEHEGEGEIAPARAAKIDEGLVWMLRGKGLHTLTLSLRVPLRQASGGSQLLLTLPERPDSFGGEMRLQLPPESLVEPTEGVEVETTATTEGNTLVEGLLPSDRIDLRWRPLVAEAAPGSRTLTNITVRLRGDRVQLAARQEVRLGTNGPRSVDVQLPSGGFTRIEPVRINDASGAERQVQPLPTDKPGWVRVPLEGMLGAVRLDWLFEMAFDDSTHQITIDGLDVQGADDQSGTISIEGFDRHLLTRRPDSMEGVTRIGVDELPAAGAFANLAYRFQTGSYRLVFDVDPIESTYRVTPIYVLELAESRARLTARFLMSIDEGQVDALSLIWPQFEQQGWTLEPLAIGGGEVRRDEVPETPEDTAEAAEAPLAESPPTRWLLKPSSPLIDQSRPGVAAERAIVAEARQAKFTVRLPQVSGARMLPGVCVIATADDVEATASPLEGTVLVRQRALSDEIPLALDELGDQARTIYEIYSTTDNGETAIDVDLRVQPRQIRTRSRIVIEQVEPEPQFTQSIDFEVEFGRMSSVRLRVPDGIVGDLREEFRDDALPFRLDGKPLSAKWQGTSVELTLPQPRRGQFQIVAGPYEAPAMKLVPDRLTVPVIACVDHPFESLRIAAPTGGAVGVDLPEGNWTRLTTVVGSREWMTTQSPEQIELSLNHSLEGAAQELSIAAAWIESTVDASGNVRTTARYDLRSSHERLVVQIPASVSPPTVAWDGVELSPSQVTAVPESADLFRIAPPNAGAGELSVTYLTRGRPLGWSRSTSIPFPSFGEGIAAEQTFWRVRLPQTYHLFTFPETLSPRFQWTRHGLIWSRTADAGLENVWPTPVGSDAPMNGDVGGWNAYPFETLGTLSEVRIRSMSNSLLVFLGAGLTLAASFLVLKVPAARSLWVWLTLGSLAAIAALWNLDAVLLLLQPAIYGMILPVTAALLDRMTSRRSVLPESLSTRRSFELSLPESVDSPSGEGSSRDAPVSSTLVRPKALTDSGVR